MDKRCRNDHSGSKIFCDKEYPVRDAETFVSICKYGKQSTYARVNAMDTSRYAALLPMLDPKRITKMADILTPIRPS